MTSVPRIIMRDGAWTPDFERHPRILTPAWLELLARACEHCAKLNCSLHFDRKFHDVMPIVEWKAMFFKGHPK